MTLTADLLLEIIIALNMAFKVVQRFESSILSEQNPSLEEVWHRLCELVSHMSTGRDSKLELGQIMSVYC